MSQVGIIFDNKSNTSLKSESVSIEFDAVLSEDHVWSNEVTTNPIETGSTVADHIIKNPDRIRMSGFVTNSPLDIPQQAEGDDSETEFNDRVADIFSLLKGLADNKQIVDVFTKYIVYPNMAMISCAPARNQTSGDSVEFEMEFVNLNFANTQTAKVPAGISKKLDKKSGDDIKKKTEPKKDAGAKQPDGGNDASIAKNLNLSKIKDVAAGIAKQILAH